MKTPDEIKMGLETCYGNGSCDECPYHLVVEGSFGCDEMGCDDSLMPDALAYIQQLEAEREAAVKDLGIMRACEMCKNYVRRACDEPCKDCWGGKPFWEWRGLPEPPKEDE